MHPRHLIKSSPVSLSMLFFAPVFAHAQDVPKACGELAHAEIILERHVDLFVDDEFAWFREGSKIQQLNPGVERARVTDKKVCKRVMRAALKALNEIFEAVDEKANEDNDDDKGDDDDGEDSDLRKKHDDDDDDEEDLDLTKEHVDFAIFQYGPYYAVEIEFKAPEGYGGYTPFLIFQDDDDDDDGDDLEFLGWIMV